MHRSTSPSSSRASQNPPGSEIEMTRPAARCACAPFALDGLIQRKRYGRAHQKNEKREDEVVEGEALEGQVLKLPGQKDGRPAAGLRQRLHQGIRPDDPEHIEPAQGVQRK